MSSLKLVKNNNSAELLIFGPIGADAWGDGYEVSAMAVANALQEASGVDLDIKINSPGGSIFEAKTISALLQGYTGQITTTIVGIAASAASWATFAASKSVRAYKGAFLMIHNAHGAAYGDKVQMRKTADLLDKLDASMAQSYADATGRPVEEFLDAMSVETFYTAEEALAVGLVSEIVDADAEPLNSRALKLLDGAPKNVLDKLTPSNINTQAEARRRAVELLALPTV